MHPNPSFRGVEAARNLAFARDRAFGVLTMAGEEGPLVSHIPFLLSEDGGSITAHIVKSNPIWRMLKESPRPALLAISGPDGYVSPDWYGASDQVPTWNYVAVHLRGEARLADEASLRSHLDALSASFEARLAPKPPWTADKMDEDTLKRMMRMIAPIEMTVADVQGTWKLNQNKPEAQRLGAAAEIEASGAGVELAALAALMKAPPA